MSTFLQFFIAKWAKYRVLRTMRERLRVFKVEVSIGSKDRVLRTRRDIPINNYIRGDLMLVSMHERVKTINFIYKEPKNQAEMDELLAVNLSQAQLFISKEVPAFPKDTAMQLSYQNTTESIANTQYTLQQLYKNKFFPKDQAYQVLDTINELAKKFKDRLNANIKFNKEPKDPADNKLSLIVRSDNPIHAKTPTSPSVPSNHQTLANPVGFGSAIKVARPKRT